MKESYLFDMTLNNIVFKGRNKAYGAYRLRTVYHRHIIIAAIVAVAIFSGALISSMVTNAIFGKPEPYVKPIIDIVKPVVIVLPPPPVTPPQQETIVPPAAKEKVATAAYSQTIVVPDNANVREVELATQEELKTAEAGTKTEAGIPLQNTQITEADLLGIDGGNGTTAPETIDAPFHSADKMPEFKGGMEALAKYLGKKLQYPASAKAHGIEGTVVVTFVVARNGAIEQIEILKGLGFGTDEETIRVIEGMPLWEPGKQGGKPVAVRYTLPVKFTFKR